MANHVTTKFKIEGISGDALLAAQNVFLNADRVIDFNVIVPMPSCLRGFNPYEGVIGRAKLALGLVKIPPVNPVSINNHMLTLNFANAYRAATTPANSAIFKDIARAISNYAECGYFYWYDWCCNKWETKWNAYFQPTPWPGDATEFTFKTAWAHPEKLMRLISERIGDVSISVLFADEDIGCNCGHYRLRAGKVEDEDRAPPYSEMTDAEKNKWRKFAFLLLYPDGDFDTYCEETDA